MLVSVVLGAYGAILAEIKSLCPEILSFDLVTLIVKHPVYLWVFHWSALDLQLRRVNCVSVLAIIITLSVLVINLAQFLLQHNPLYCILMHN